MPVTVHIDGGARGNPGEAGAGVVIRDDDGTLLLEAGFYLGRTTNNVAEYNALLRALQWLEQTGTRDGVTILCDSELVVYQLTGQYQVKSPKLRPLFEEAQRRLLRIGRWQIRHVPRQDNRRADLLANQAMDEKADIVLTDTAGVFTPDRPGRRDGSTAEPAVREPAAGEDDQETPGPGAVRQVEIVLQRAPSPQACPAGGCPKRLSVGATLPEGLCVYAAHALVPTILAIQHTAAHEIAAVPTLTLRCTRPGCDAVFQVSPRRSSNGSTTTAVP